TYGRVSGRGVVPLSWSFDHVGPITNSVYDAALMLQVLGGYDAGDRASVDVPVPDYARELNARKSGESLRGLRVGLPRAFFFEELDSEVAAAVERAIRVFRELGAEIHDDVRLEVPTDRTLSSTESWAYHEPFVARSPELYQPATLARIKSGERITVDAVARAKKELSASREAIGKTFAELDVLLTPTVPISPPRIADLLKNPDNLRPTELMMLRNTRPFNVWGIPTISVPCGFTKDGMPIGLQLAAAHWREDVVLRAADAYERAAGWPVTLPPI
ncbi:MAG: amidase, partial [Terriglobales bacterium]